MRKIFFQIAIVMFIASLMPFQAYAAGSGAFRLGFGDAESLAKGGAFVGEADNAAAVYHNPAGLIQLEDGQHLSAGFAWLNIFVDHENALGGNIQMRRENIIIPQLYYVNDLDIENFSLGFGVRSNNGASTEWAEDSFSKYVATRTDLENVDYLVAGAYQLNDQVSVGVGVDVVNSKFSQNKILNQQPGTDAGAQFKLQDYGVGYTLSTLFKANEQHQFGLQYRSGIDLSWEGKVTMSNLNDLGATALATIFGGSGYSNDARWDVTLPQNIVFGYSFKPDEKWRFNFDAEWTDWSTIEQEVFDFPGETNATRLTVLHAATDLPLDWESSWAYSLGGEYAFNDRLDLRAGYFFHETPIKNPNFNTFLPDSDSHGINLGFGYDVNDSAIFDMSWTGIFYNDRDVSDNTFGASSGANINGTYEEYVNIVMMTLNYKFGGN